MLRTDGRRDTHTRRDSQTGSILVFDKGLQMTTSIEIERLATRLDSSIYYDDQKAAGALRDQHRQIEILECALKDADIHIAEQALLHDHVRELRESLSELTECGSEAWGDDRPCVRIAREVLEMTK